MVGPLVKKKEKKQKLPHFRNKIQSQNCQNRDTIDTPNAQITILAWYKHFNKNIT